MYEGEEEAKSEGFRPAMKKLKSKLDDEGASGKCKLLGREHSLMNFSWDNFSLQQLLGW